MNKSKKYIIFIIIVLTSLTLSPLILRNDVHISKIKHTEPISLMNDTSDPRGEREEAWISRNKLRIDEGNISLIIRLDLKKAYLLNHKLRSYSEADLPLELKKIYPPPALKLLEEAKVTGNVTDTGEEKKIRKWSCRKYLIEINGTLTGIDFTIKQEYWFSNKIGAVLNHYQKFKGEIFLLNPLMKELREKIRKIDGYPILIKSSFKILGKEVKIMEEVVSIERKKPPQGIYELPEGYKKTKYSTFSF